MKKKIDVDGRQRQYLVFVPSKGQGPMPLVIVLHGGGGSARQMERYTRFDELAEKAVFVTVYPESVGGNWNDGRGVAAIPAQRENIDDVKFMRSIVDDVAKEHDIDRRRVFATGISNGGMMAHRLAAEASDLVAAIAPVAGGLPKPLAEKFQPQLPTSILIIQGDADPIVPYGGGNIVVGRERPRGQVIPAEAALARYVELNGNRGEPAKSTLDADPTDATSVEVLDYADGRAGAKTRFYRVRGGGHAWPGRPPYAPAAVIGKVSQDFSATDAIWQFFASCPPRSKP